MMLSDLHRSTPHWARRRRKSDVSKGDDELLMLTHKNITDGIGKIDKNGARRKSVRINDGFFGDATCRAYHMMIFT